jgi:hypothetical protein
VSAGKFIMDGVASWIEEDKGGARIAVALGLDGAGRDKVEKAAQEVYVNGFAGSLLEAQQTVEAVGSTVLDVSTASQSDLAEMSIAAQLFADIFDQDVAVAMSTVKRVSEDLGVSGPKAMDLLLASLEGADVALRGDLFEAITEYSKDFHALGYSAEEAMGVFVKGGEAGKFVLDKLPDSIKEFQIKMNEGSAETRSAFAAMGMDFDDFATVLANGGPDAKNAFGYILTNLDAVADEATRRDYGTAIFGTPFEDLGPDSGKLLDAMRPDPTLLAETEGKAAEMGQKAGESFAGPWDMRMRQMEVDWNNGLDRMAAAPGESAGALVEEFERNLQNFAGKAGYYVDTVEDAFGEIPGWLGGLVEQIENLGDTVGHYFDTVEEAFGEIPGWLGGAWEHIENLVGEIPGWLGGIWEQVENLFGKIPEALGKIFEGLESLFLDPLKTAWNAAADWFNGLTFPTMGPWDINAGPLGSFTIGPYGGWDLPDLPKFDQGGIVPGRIGSPQMILAHGGETVLPTHKQDYGAGVGGVNIVQNINTVASPSEVAQVSTALLMRRIRPR